MKVSTFAKKALFPPASPSQFDTGLRFTDILFGFVISQLFIRLQNWGDLAPVVKYQLIAGTILVLGSWIGFRRSVNRSAWEVKFVNLPLFRFVLDQLMVILYFRIAVLTPEDPNKKIDPDSLVSDTLQSLFFIFVLYALWDLLGMFMAVAKERVWREGREPVLTKYPMLDDEKRKIKEPRTDSIVDRAGFLISAVFLGLFTVLYWALEDHTFDATDARTMFLVSAILLVFYRFFKEIKTSLLPKATPASDDANPPDAPSGATAVGGA
jgi:hypothetical protein